jgi:SAM-dependent methyltransferase
MAVGVDRVAGVVAAKVQQRLEPRLTAVSESAARDGAYAAQLVELLRGSTAADPHRLFDGVSDDFWLWINTVGVRYFAELSGRLPTMPPEFNQLASASATGDQTLADGFGVYQLFRDIADQHGPAIVDCDAVLDFGCGWGRVLRFFLRDLPGDKLWGVDLWDDQITWAKQTNPWCHFATIEKLPPSTLADRSFDMVMAYSVFSHVSEAVHSAWLAEFGRILKPGGLIVVTTWGRDKALRFDAVKHGGQQAWDPVYNDNMARFFPGKEAWWGRYDSGEFCHIDLHYQGDPGYGETCIPKEYVLREWTKDFEFVDYIDDRALCPQDVVVVRKC